jgi:hypothetical protein
MKWGTKYGADYVNRLYGMVRRHLRGDFRFVCLTDRSDGVRTEVQCLPIPDLALPDGIPERGWKKLTTFAADLQGRWGFAPWDNPEVYRFELGSHPEVLERFRVEHASIRARLRNEQAWLSEVLHQQGRLDYWPADWCASWKYHCVPRFPLNYFKAPAVPRGARILVFHGVVNPPDAIAGRSMGNWRRTLAAPWLEEHWQA